MENSEKNRDKYSYGIKMLDIDSEELNIPAQDMSCSVTLVSSDLQHHLKRLADIADNCSITVSSEGVQFCCANDLSTGTATVVPSDGVSMIDQTISGMYSYKFLSLFAKAASVAPAVLPCHRLPDHPGPQIDVWAHL